MSEELLIKHCAPTLAGMKTGNMFSCACESLSELRNYIRKLNKLLVKKGLRVIPLKFSDGRALIYVYRPRRLSKDLTHDTASRLLEERNYSGKSSDRCVLELMKRINESKEFPHEIGLFLGYPPEDVCGFIENKAADCKCVGAWKVYGDVEAAKKTFAKYKKCTDAYCSLFAKGRSIERLTVADRI